MRNVPKRLALTRDQPVEPGATVLIVIDVQNQTIEDQKQVHNSYFLKQLTALVLPNLQRLIRAARETGAEVMYTVIENLTRDGRDRSLDYKLSNIFVAKGSWQAKVVDAIKPGDDASCSPKRHPASSTRRTSTTCCATSGLSISS